ncbi:putative lipase KNAG_0D01190 [Huiozyma naganishii CBS 8797]|uniref:triacylglycerol lipase n=1 Tax=Huiozyma naganishii (strain ATCC MYA-139 / BCRC 22969 / CBS 8797 / KCTC 17520 / NBRC 10181 / NCYC 3082 / Yp74L-3) TaxID=1071383 RepID=J7S6N0_HUIN7|nr:hypothetical protein KNAG_0D01190 [Kazachstania naganishii CBS 8797]CCK69871.1 hypothetical protein KNAG_0D01190 [Kazachstania naganishii CBS 8797]
MVVCFGVVWVVCILVGCVLSYPAADKRPFFTPEIYDRLVYFSKACALTSCITRDQLSTGKTLYDNGCPKHIRFCNDLEENPTADRTKISMVLAAQRGELGTGYVIVDYVREVVIMAFRSSTTTQDWISDFTTLPIDYEPVSKEDYEELIEKGEIRECANCKLHRGFHRFTETLSREFLDRMEQILERYPNYKTVVIGHSLGGAMASIAAIELRLKGYHPMVLMYAPPKIFNSEMKEWVDELFETREIHEQIMESGVMKFNKGFFRVVHAQDYIPMIPPFFESAGVEIFINKREIPHTIDDLEYRGIYNIPVAEMTIRDNMNKLARKWLHTYEHQNYFITLMGCKGF